MRARTALDQSAMATRRIDQPLAGDERGSVAAGPVLSGLKDVMLLHPPGPDRGTLRGGSGRVNDTGHSVDDGAGAGHSSRLGAPAVAVFSGHERRAGG